MQFLIDYWMLLVVAAAVLVAGVLSIWKFAKLPTNEQINAVKEWLVGVVVEAERELGSGTGALKLRQVYDLFVIRFPWMAKIISFDTFAMWVDDALVVMRDMLESNQAVKEYVNGDYEIMETRKVGF